MRGIERILGGLVNRSAQKRGDTLDVVHVKFSYHKRSICEGVRVGTKDKVDACTAVEETLI